MLLRQGERGTKRCLIKALLEFNWKLAIWTESFFKMPNMPWAEWRTKSSSFASSRFSETQTSECEKEKKASNNSFYGMGEIVQ